jgi:hypothetical protein
MGSWNTPNEAQLLNFSSSGKGNLIAGAAAGEKSKSSKGRDEAKGAGDGEGLGVWPVALPHWSQQFLFFPSWRTGRRRKKRYVTEEQALPRGAGLVPLVAFSLVFFSW